MAKVLKIEVHLPAMTSDSEAELILEAEAEEAGYVIKRNTIEYKIVIERERDTEETDGVPYRYLVVSGYVHG